MYNTVKLREQDWCFQRYIWEKDLDSTKIPEEKVVKTLIYGVKSSGNQSEQGLRETAKLSQNEFPEVNRIIHKDVYVDDCISGESCIENALLRADELEVVMNRGGFALKGIAFSGEDPPESLSDDGVSLNIGGMKWYPKDDELSLNISNLNFAKKYKGKKPVNETKAIPLKLTRRQCVAKVAEIFDITGKLTPITASMKLDLHELITRKLDWDDCIPDDLRPIWTSNFELMQEINNLRYKRTIVPDDAIDLRINTIDTGDASRHLACVAIYARFKRRNGDHSCQLVLSRSRVIPKDMSQPRAELYAALLNSHTGEIVRRSFYNWHKSAIKVTDSQIVLHWISNEDKPLKQWTRNRIIEIRRFTSPDQWFYVHSKDMIADLGTRRGATLNDVNQDSDWIQGMKWMKLESSDFPIKSVGELNLNNQEFDEVAKETQSDADFRSYNSIVKFKVPDEVSKRYEFSSYLIDPNRYRYKKVVRILAFVSKFCTNLIQRIRNCRSNRSLYVAVKTSPYSTVYLSDHDIYLAEMYLFRKCSLEIKHFLPVKAYSSFTTEKNGVLMYTGRILPTEKITVVGEFTDAMKDLTATTFCVPVVEKHSPIAFSIVNEVHWHDKTAQHSGIETTLRYVLKRAYIIEARSIVKLIKKSCQRCRYLAKKALNVAMGPVSSYNLTIAPAFYVSQVDLAGPFKAYSPHQKRTTIKVWLSVFCCTTTSTVSIKTLDDYSTTSFIQAFLRFSAEVGYPKILLCDEGSQLVSACENMKLTFHDIKHQLHRDVKVEFDVCPVNGHNMHGKVERKIREIKSSINKIAHNERLSILQWETIVAEIANNINDLPLALGNVTSDLENMDLLTPNRLRLGRNNDRSPAGNMILTRNPSKLLQDNHRIFTSWFENWLLIHVPKLMTQQKWFKTQSLSVGDVVLFLKNENLTPTYQYGLVKSIEFSKDNVVRKAKIKYKDHNENSYRETYRSARHLVVIQHVDESNVLNEIGEIASKADRHFQQSNTKLDQ